ncbi:MAG: rhodanese-like domain-containing protein [Flavobacteriales bacterium]|nr:rhodanese-like domain-containing protein [Flavobacteriales bacterium]
MSVQEIIKSGKATLIDVREESELINEGRVPNAIHIPLGDIEYKVEEIEQMQKPIVLFCRSGNRSGKAIDFLESEGLEDLHNGMGFRDVLQALEE